MTESINLISSIKYRRTRQSYNRYILLGLIIIALFPSHAFGQKFDASFIQYSRDIEEILVLETEAQKSWINKNAQDTIHWKREGIVINEMPRFSGCEDIAGDPTDKRKCSDQKMLEYMYSNLVYPVEALEDRIEGSVIIQFYVNPDGKISNAFVKKGMGAYTAGAALDLVEKMNEERTWIPGRSKDGVATPTLYTLPIRFKLGPDNRIQHPKMYSKYYDTNNEWNLIYDSEDDNILNEEAEVRMLISNSGKVLNARIYDPLSPVARERINEIILDLLNNSTWHPGSIYDFENTMEYVFTVKM